MDELNGVELDAFRKIKLMNIKERLTKQEYEVFLKEVSVETIDKKFEELFKK